MQPGDGFAYDGGPMNGSHGQLPAGSRLSQYLGANRQGPSFGGPSHPVINIDAPPFIPKQQFSQMTLSDSHVPPPFNAPPPTSSYSRPPAPTFEIPNRYQLESRGGTTFFYQPPVGGVSAPDGLEDNYELEAEGVPEGHVIVNTQGVFGYHAPLPVPHIGKFRPKGSLGNGQAQFVNPELKMDLLNRQLAIDAKCDPNVYPDIPSQVEHLTNLVPLENVVVNNLSQTTYKGSSIRDGVAYCIRRIHNFRLHSGKHNQTAENWKKVIHGNIVQMREVMTNCRAFDDTSLIVVYDYYPLAETLKSRHFGARTGTFLDSMTGIKLANTVATSSLLGGTGGIPESTLWAYVIQISAALRAVHANGLACRSIELNKILLYSNNKVLLSFCGLQDLINPDPTPAHQQQLEDLQQFGCVLVALATGKPHGSRRDLLMASMNSISQSYSVDMKNLISYLLSSPNNRKSINDIMPMIGARFYNYMENMQQRNDCLEAELCKELENGRLFRLLCKLNTILERTEYNGDENWSETGDRFMLKLFRDYVFHQVTDQGKPWLDMAHIVQCLNKLDSGSMEKIEMVSRDGNIQIIVDYSQLKRCIEKSFRDLLVTNVISRH